MEARAKKLKAKAIAARNARGIRRPRATAQESPRILLMGSLIDQGMNFFMSNYAMGIDQPPVHSKAYHKHLSTDGFHPLVATSMTALGIAGVANLYKDSGLRRQATRWYLDAIRMANLAISCPKEVKADTTLIAVNLLGMFEATFNENSLNGWSNHVDGAASLVKIRGMDQFSTPAGQRMYLHVIGLLTMNCMGKGMALPQYVRDMNEEIMKFLDVNDPRNAFFFLHIKTIDLRACIFNQKKLNLTDIIQCALDLDKIAISIFKDTGPDWDYKEVPCSIQKGVYGNFYHIYSSHASAQTRLWTMYNRIYFHDIIRNSILAGFATVPPTIVGSLYHDQLSESTRLLTKLQSNIMASMPQFLHDVPMDVPCPANDSNASRLSDLSTAKMEASTEETSSLSDPPNTSLTDHALVSSSLQSGSKSLHQNFRGDSASLVKKLVGNGSIKDRIPIVRISGGHSIVWALYVAGSMPTASRASQNFVFKCLNRIGQEFGINQAKVLANILKAKVRLHSSQATAFEVCPQYLPSAGGPYVSRYSTLHPQSMSNMY